MKWLKVVAFAIVAAVAAYKSFWHMYDQITVKTAESDPMGISPYILPISVDGLLVVAAIEIRTARTLGRSWVKLRKNLVAYIGCGTGLLMSGWANWNSVDKYTLIAVIWAIWPVFALFASLEAILGTVLQKPRSKAKAVVEPKTDTTAQKPKKWADLTEAEKKAIRSERSKRAALTNRRKKAIAAEDAAIAQAEQILA